MEFEAAFFDSVSLRREGLFACTKIYNANVSLRMCCPDAHFVSYKFGRKDVVLCMSCPRIVVFVHIMQLD